MFAGLSRFPGNAFPFPWHVHEYPFPHSGIVAPCGVEITGGHFDPLGAFQNPNYMTDCSPRNPAACEIGDLSGKFEPFPRSDPLQKQYSDQFLSLYGVNSIVGRSVVIHFTNSSRLVCANIGYPDLSSSQLLSGGLLYSRFRNNFTGDIFFRQHTLDSSTSSVYTNLRRVVREDNSNDHNWHVHRDPLGADREDCMTAGPHYNPRGVNVSEPGYSERCGFENSTRQINCEIGDLSSKGAPFDVQNRRTQQFYTDTDLPLLPDADGYSIDNRSVVIHAPDRGGPRIACANLTRFTPLEAITVFNENGVSGSIRFYQRSPYDHTRVTVGLRGLSQMADGYHVHEYPVGPESLSSPGKCADAYTGGHWNPTNVTSSGSTSDEFEIGDLSGKFGGLAGLDELSAVYTDPNIPLFGPFSVIGRSIVIHRPDGSRWLCSDVQHNRQVLQIVTTFETNSFSGNITFSQAADDPYAETTIVVAIDVHQMLRPPPPAVSSSSIPAPVELSPTSIAMATSLGMSTDVVTMTTSSMTMATSSVIMTSSQALLVPQSTSTRELPTSFTSRLPQPEPTPSSPSPLTSSIDDDGSGSTLLIPFGGDEVTGTYYHNSMYTAEVLEFVGFHNTSIYLWMWL